MTKRTPCVGICSTTYGDLVCRGCKRFAHEIVQWNGYDLEQQNRVWQRLHQLRDEVVLQHLRIDDAAVFAAACQRAELHNLECADMTYQLTRMLVGECQPLQAAGLVSQPAGVDPLAVLQAIDAEVYARSLAHYERNFRTPA